MLSSMPQFLSEQNYIPHGMCLLWQPALLWLHVISDAVIATAYFTIPFALAYFIAKRHDLAFRGIFALTGAFILACGTTHAMGIVTLWYPVYWIDGAIKLCTAFVSIGTASAMWRAMPLALALPSTEQLEHANGLLKRQIAERQRAEEMLRRVQKMEAVGQLTGGVAHDFNNLLSVIIGNAEFLLDAVRNEPERLELTREILNSAMSGADLTRRLLAFARRQPLQPQLIDLTELLPRQLTMLHRLLGDTIHVTATLAPDLWLTHADPSQVGDVLLNLALNARDAMPCGGELSIETANSHLEADSAGANGELGEGDYVVLTVTDTGSGMSPDVAERAIEPFFTTKPSSAGSGLGLSMAYGFAKQSGGHLKIESRLQVGTMIRLYLPRARSNVGTVQNALTKDADDLTGTEVVLLVDDNAILLDVTRRYLVALGYKVVTAANGPSALAKLQSGEIFHLLFTDVVMPDGMSGYDLAEAARLRQPGLKVLFTAGFVTEPSMHGEQHMLRKPYQQRDIARAVRATLDGHEIAN
jgi:signal transduction histidine kinase/ActR/RegA family two-component response regulator